MEVACALIISKSKVLLARRPAHKKQGLKWEFPGGKLEPGETASQALCRELAEELGLRVTPTDLHPLGEVMAGKILLKSFLLPLKSAYLPREHGAFAWVSDNNLDAFDLCESDQITIERYSREIRERITLMGQSGTNK